MCRIHALLYSLKERNSYAVSSGHYGTDFNEICSNDFRIVELSSACLLRIADVAKNLDLTELIGLGTRFTPYKLKYM
jgi:hypothetical protein